MAIPFATVITGAQEPVNADVFVLRMHLRDYSTVFIQQRGGFVWRRDLRLYELVVNGRGAYVALRPRIDNLMLPALKEHLSTSDAHCRLDIVEFDVIQN